MELMACAWLLLPLFAVFCSPRRPFSWMCVYAWKEEKRTEEEKGKVGGKREVSTWNWHIFNGRFFSRIKTSIFRCSLEWILVLALRHFCLLTLKHAEVIFCENECFVFGIFFEWKPYIKWSICVKIWHAQTTHTSPPLCTTIFEVHRHVNENSVNVQRSFRRIIRGFSYSFDML